MEKQINLLKNLALFTLIVLIAACDLGMVEKPAFNKKTDTGGQLIIDGQYDGSEETGGDEEHTGAEETGNNEETGGEETYTPSSNANIRAFSGEGANALYGLYIGSMPGIDNGDPKSNTSDFTINDVTIWGNYTTADPAGSSVVVIVEDEKVSKVEFGMTASYVTAKPSSASDPDSWIVLTQNDEYTTTDTVGKRWTGSCSNPARPSSSSYRQAYVRITAEDGTIQYYRYIQYISSTAPTGNNAARGELNALTIGGVTVVNNAANSGTNKKGTYTGWWNKTVAPGIEPGEVTLTAAQAENVSVSATFYMSNEQAGSVVSYAKVSEWPLKESAVTFTDFTTTTTSNIVVTNQSIGSVANGDYIILRRNPPSSATYTGLFGHYIIKVNVTN